MLKKIYIKKNNYSLYVILLRFVISLLEWLMAIVYLYDYRMITFNNHWTLLSQIVDDISIKDSFPLSIIFILLLIENICEPTTKLNWNDYWFSFFLSAFLVVAYSYKDVDSAILIYWNRVVVIQSIILFAGSFLLILSLIKYVKYYLVRIYYKFPCESHIFKYGLPGLMCLLMLAWFPYALVRFPAAFEWDAYHQLMQYKGDYVISAHWPLVSTYFLGTIYKIGSYIFNSDSIGVLFFVILQMLICAFCFSYSILVLKKLKVRSIACTGVFLIYALIPIFARYITAIVKDTLFSAFVVLYVSILVEVVLVANNAKKTIALCVTSTVVSLLRNNGIYIIFFVFTVLIVFFIRDHQKHLRTLILSHLITIAITVLFFNVITPAMGIPKGNIKEVFSIPLQQTARYVKNYSNEVTKEEEEAIRNVIDYDHIEELYDPRLSDPIKGTFHMDSKSDLVGYLKTWFIQFFKHPITYIAATFNNTFEFFLPGSRERTEGIYTALNCDEEICYFKEDSSRSERMNTFRAWIRFLERIPLLFFVGDCGIQFWIVIALVLVSLKRKDKYLFLILIPSIVGILVCIASPTYTHNGLRYALPVIYSSPFVSVVAMHRCYCCHRPGKMRI